MQILGNSARVPTDVILECHPDLMGDNVSAHLSQSAGSAALWTLSVDVHIIQGWFRLGSMITSSPRAGRVPARTVLIASCPGAIGWRVIASCPTNGENADLVLQSSTSSAGAGVTVLEGVRIGAPVEGNWGPELGKIFNIPFGIGASVSKTLASYPVLAAAVLAGKVLLLRSTTLCWYAWGTTAAALSSAASMDASPELQGVPLVGDTKERAPTTASFFNLLGGPAAGVLSISIAE